MLRALLPGDLAGVRRAVALAIHLAEAAKREAFRCDERSRVLEAADGAVEERLVPDEPPSRADANVVTGAGGRVHGPIRRLHLSPLRFEFVGSRIAEPAAVKYVAPALGDQVHDATRGLSELRLESRRLDLGLLDELGRHSGSERVERAGVRADASVSAVGDVDAIDDIGVLEAAAAADGRIRRSDAAAVADPRHHVQR